MSIARLACLALPFAALFAAGPASADVPRLLAAENVEGLASAPPYFYWVHNDCAPDIPGRNSIRSMELAPAGAGAISYLYLPRTLFGTPCGNGQVWSRSIAVDERHIYWITWAGWLRRMRRDGSASPESLAQVNPAPFGHPMSVANGWVVWSDGSGVYRRLTAATTPPGIWGTQRVMQPSGDSRAIRDLLPAGDGYALTRYAALEWLVPTPGFGTGFFPLRIADSVTAFTADASRVYMAQRRSGGGYAITAVTRAPNYQFTRLERYIETRPGLTVDQIAVDGTALYWHVADQRGTGPVVRQPHNVRDAARITADVRISPQSRLTSSNSYLSWATNEGLVLLPANAPAMP